ncbi:M28 family peptidase [Falsiroseomonas selenitidurans]|uniref:M28 family peptidase n=1 Tax=Falsiroseomonas selenitidurans TaxID=2716335 RepID=A0ABX1E2N8_9PROT|nr:M28 family peptidase [Falsiroseomonas selenitidurans]NKC30083.1 M28 family peptidase [Falsiroseomonas selenitidurans]
MTDAVPASLTASVSGAEMMANLREIARWMKLSGEPEELESIRFLERRMQDYGFRTQLILHDAYISLPGKASVLVEGRALGCITQSFSCPGRISGVPVYLGHGTDADFAGRDLAGRIVLCEGMATPAVAQRASRAGAAGQLHISHHEHIHEMCISPVWGNPGASTLEELPTTIACSVNNADGGAIRDALAAGAQPVVTLEAEVDTGWRKTPLLVAELGEPDAPFVLMSGHQDTWYYGVMDNGSANAGMMEAARLCAQQQGQWQRGLRVCFWSGHSHGRYSGSAWYADTHWEELDRRCAAHVNVDSLGGTGATALEHAAAMTELKHIAAEAVQAQTNQAYTGKRKARNSDESFVGIGIPSMLGSISEQAAKHAQARNALGWWWHTPHDLIDKIDEANLVRDARVLTQVVWTLLSAPVVPLDHAATASALLAELAPLAAKLEGRLDLDGLVAAATALRDSAAGIPRRAAKDAAAASAALMRASRALVPVDYTPGDRFSHAAALPLPPWAVLQPIRDLAATTPGTDAEKFAAVDAMRARNRMRHALREAQAAIDAALAALN